MSTITLRRKLNRSSSPGSDIEAMKRAIFKWRHQGELHDFMGKPVKVRQRFQHDPWTRLVGQVNTLALGPGSKETDFTTASMRWLDDHGFVDDLARRLLKIDEELVVPTLVYPIAKPARSSVCQGSHVTSGIPGNVAFDFCAAPGSQVLAVEAGWVTRLSGHDPLEDLPDNSGVFGWSVYFETLAGYRYFTTHYGKRHVKVGEKVVAGTVLGTIGDQRFRPDHLHYGVTSPFGPSDAFARMAKVAAAKHVLPVPRV